MTLLKKLHYGFYVWNMVSFSRIVVKSNSRRIAQKILSKEVKLVLQVQGGGTRVAIDCTKNEVFY